VLIIVTELLYLLIAVRCQSTSSGDQHWASTTSQGSDVVVVSTSLVVVRTVTATDTLRVLCEAVRNHYPSFISNSSIFRIRLLIYREINYRMHICSLVIREWQRCYSACVTHRNERDRLADVSQRSRRWCRQLYLLHRVLWQCDPVAALV